MLSGSSTASRFRCGVTWLARVDPDFPALLHLALLFTGFVEWWIAAARPPIWSNGINPRTFFCQLFVDPEFHETFGSYAPSWSITNEIVLLPLLRADRRRGGQVQQVARDDRDDRLPRRRRLAPSSYLPAGYRSHSVLATRFALRPGNVSGFSAHSSPNIAKVCREARTMAKSPSSFWPLLLAAVIASVVFSARPSRICLSWCLQSRSP